MGTFDNHRVREVLDYLKKEKVVRNQQDFTERIGFDKATMSLVLNNKTSASNNLFDLISQTFPCIDRNWLVTGEGEMLKSVESKPNGNFYLVPLINIDSVGGVHSDNEISPSEQHLIRMLPFTDARQGDVAILQTGNSMAPTIPSGSALLIRKVDDWQEYFGYGNIYVLWLRDGRRITKEIRRYDADPHNYVWCVSYNPNVADEELPRSFIVGVWKVIKYISDFGW